MEEALCEVRESPRYRRKVHQGAMGKCDTSPPYCVKNVIYKKTGGRMAEERIKREQIQNNLEREVAAYKKKSKSASQSVTDKRSDHKHDYKSCILEDSALKRFFWGEQCSICGRVKKDNWFKAKGKEGLVKEVVKVQSFKFDIFYTIPELRKLFPNVKILRIKIVDGEWKYEEV